MHATNRRSLILGSAAVLAPSRLDRAVQGLLDAWASAPTDDFPNYAAGSVGPAAADRLLAGNGHAWLPIAADHPPARRTA